MNATNDSDLRLHTHEIFSPTAVLQKTKKKRLAASRCDENADSSRLLKKWGRNDRVKDTQVGRMTQSYSWFEMEVHKTRADDDTVTCKCRKAETI